MKFTLESDEARKSLNLERGIIAAVVRSADSATLFEVKNLIPHVELFATEGGRWKAILDAPPDPWPPAVDVPDDWQASAAPTVDAEHLRNRFERRLFARLQDQLAGLMKTEASTPADLLKAVEEASADIRRVQREYRRNEQAQPGVMLGVREAMAKLLADLSEQWTLIQEKGRDAVQIGVPTGIGQLDRILGGLREGIHCLAAEPGKGKTSLVLQIARHAASRGVPTLFASFEEGIDRLSFKTACALAQLESKQFFDGHADPNLIVSRQDEICSSIGSLKFVTGGPTMTVGRLRALAEQLRSASQAAGPCLVIVDYLQQWARMRRGAGNDFRLEVSQLATDLRGLAQDLASPVLMISSQNRDGQGSSSMRSLKESGDLEYGADSLWFLVVDDTRSGLPPNQRPVKIDIQKNRFGDLGFAPLVFKANIGTFVEQPPAVSGGLHGFGGR